MKCRCPSETHGHKPGKCNNLAATSGQLCKPCHDKTQQEIKAVPRVKRPALPART